MNLNIPYKIVVSWLAGPLELIPVKFITEKDYTELLFKYDDKLYKYSYIRSANSGLGCLYDSQNNLIYKPITNAKNSSLADSLIEAARQLSIILKKL